MTGIALTYLMQVFAAVLGVGAFGALIFCLINNRPGLAAVNACLIAANIALFWLQIYLRSKIGP